MDQFSSTRLVHKDELNMEKNTYWKIFHDWFMALLEEFFISVVPGLDARMRSGEVKIPPLDTRIKHLKSAFLYETLSIFLNIQVVYLRQSLVSVGVRFTKGDNIIADGFQRVKFTDRDGKSLSIPQNIIDLAAEVDENSDIPQDMIIYKDRGDKIFEYCSEIFLRDTNEDGLTYPLVYLGLMGNSREAFIGQICPEFKSKFDSGLRIITYDTYLRNYPAAATLHDKIKVSIMVGEVSRTSSRILFSLMNKKDNLKIAEGWQVVVFGNPQGRPIMIPQGILRNANPYAVKGVNIFKYLTRKHVEEF